MASTKNEEIPLDPNMQGDIVDDTELSKKKKKKRKKKKGMCSWNSVQRPNSVREFASHSSTYDFTKFSEANKSNYSAVISEFLYIGLII